MPAPMASVLAMRTYAFKGFSEEAMMKESIVRDNEFQGLDG
jgi:hypothetical protein